MKSQKEIIGANAKITFSEFGNYEVFAKIDTGADTSAIHCTKIKEIQTDKGLMIEFSPFDHPELKFRTLQYELKVVASSNGARVARYFVETEVKVKGKKYPVTISLADRTSMTFPMLLGRKFLEQNHFLVDVSQTTK